MANTYTPTYNLILPEVGSDTNAWGTHINTNLTSIDSNMLSRALVSSQTVAGPLVFNNTITGHAAAVFDNTLTVTGASTIASLSVSGAASFASTLSVSGVCTIADMNVGGAAAFTGTITVPTPSGSTNAANKSYVDTADALKLSLSGGTMTGNLSIISGTTEMTVTLGSSGGYYYGNATTAGFKNSGGTNRVSWNISTGDFTAAGNVTAYSDVRLKDNIRTIPDALAMVNRMRGVYYTRRDTGDAGVGVVAQEVKHIVPEAVVDNSGTYSVAYGNLVGVLIEAVKELTARVEALEGK